jgi:Ni,Fe-hydrogenase III component G
MINNTMHEELEREYAKYWQNTHQYVLIRNQSAKQEDSYSIIDVKYHFFFLMEDADIKKLIVEKMLQNNAKIYQSVEEAFEANKDLYVEPRKKTIHDWYK